MCQRRLWHYGAADWEALRQYFFDFPWNDYCFRTRDPSEIAQRITEVNKMGSEQGGANSSRLSLDIAHLPLTPFGMSPTGHSRKHILFSQRTNKLSLKTHKQQKTGSKYSESERDDKENMSQQNQYHHRQQQSSRYTVLETLSEELSDNLNTYEDNNSRISEAVHVPRVQVDTHLKENIRINAPQIQIPRRQSIYTDIDEGSFIEFCQGKEEGHPVPSLKDRVIPQLYYTCETQNETQFSTSTKTNNCNVGFRKFLDTFKRQKDLGNIAEENEAELEKNKKKYINFNCDETIITCSADVVKRMKPQTKKQTVLNSTVIDKLPCEASAPLPHLFPDVSTLSLHLETVSGSSSGNPTPATSPNPLHKNNYVNHQPIIAISESSDEEDCSLQRTEMNNTNANPAVGWRGSNLYIEKHTRYDQSNSSWRQPTTGAVQKSQSLISEDVSIVSSILPTSHPQCPDRTEENMKTLTMKCDEGKPVYVEIDNDNQCVVYDFDDDEEGAIDKAVSENLREQTPENAKSPATAKWIMTSPFRDSSFGTSFLQNQNNSQISETNSQSKPPNINRSHGLSNKNSDLRSPQQDHRKQGKTTYSVRWGNKNLPTISTSSSDESDGAFQIKRSGKACLVVQSSSESDEGEPGMSYVSQRRKVFSKTRGDILPRQNYVVESSDSSCEDSLHLRLSEGHSRSDKVSEKTTNTIGRIATSCNTVKSPLLAPVSYDSDEIIQRHKPVHTRRISSSDSAQSGMQPVSLSHSLDDLPNLDTQADIPCDELTRKYTKPQYPSSVHKPMEISTNGKGIEEKMDLKKIQEELDKVYDTDWRKNETAVLNTIPRIEKSKAIQENKTLREEKANIQINLEFETDDESENSLFYQVEETIDESSQDNIDDDDDKTDTKEQSKCKERLKTSHSPSNKKCNSSSEDDSFEKYLTRVKKQIEEEREKKKKYVRVNQDEYENNFIDDGSSKEDEESFSLPSVSSSTHFPPKPRLRHCESITDSLRKPRGRGGGPGSSGSITTASSTSSWRDSPVIHLDSDSDLEEVFPVTQTKKTKPPPKLKPFTTPKITKPPNKIFPKTEGHKRQISKQYSTNSVNSGTPTHSFLASLSSNVNMMRCHPDALVYTKNFKKKRVELAEKLHKYYNTHVFNNQLPAELNIKWNNRMTKTAGFCYYQIDRNKPSGRGARIELATKVIDCPERLRDTLIHELCHAASWIISGYKAGHGPLWKAWASRAESLFPELPAITRCHSYAIQCRYTYRCTRCSYSIGRHSKSLDMEKKVCGLCYGRFQLIDNTCTPTSGTNSSAASTVPARTPKAPGAFALFVKENYGTVKQSGGGLKHAEVMKVLSAKFSKMKAGEAGE